MPRLCRIVPIDKRQLYLSRYIPCILWKFENYLVLNEFALILQKYVSIEYNINLLYQCLSLSSIDVLLHENIARIEFFGNQIIKYCCALEAYNTR